MGTPALDQIDRVILGELVRDGRVSWQELARRIGLSPTATADRVRRLEHQGVIAGYTAVVDQASFGRTLEVVIDVRAPFDVKDRVLAVALDEDGVSDVAHVTGRFDVVIRAVLAGPEALDVFLEALQAAGATETQTRLILRHYGRS